MSTQFTPSKLAAARLRDHKQRVLTLWEQRVRQELPAARPKDTPALLDSMPDLLEGLAVLLGEPLRESWFREKHKEDATRHGDQRAQFEDYSLDQIVDEYLVLRQVIVAVLEEEQPVTADILGTVSDYVLFSLRNAVSEFSRRRNEEKENAKAALEEANETLEERVKQRMAELRFSEERFRHFVESIKDYAIFTLDADGIITSWNEGCARLNRYSAEEALGQHFSMLYPEEGKRRHEPMNNLRAAAADGSFRGEGTRLRKNSEPFLADVSITPIYEDQQLVGYTKVVQDLTERQLLMQERDLTRTDLAAMRLQAEYRDRFVATLAHDLRSPLSAAKSALELIIRFPDQHDQIRPWALRVSSAVERMDRMISDLLDVSRLDAGERMALKFEPCDAMQVAQAACDELAPRHGSRFVVEASGSTTGVWSCDGLRRAFDNLLSNAVKYGEPTTPITLCIRQVGDRALMSVHNFGTIIPADEQAKLFRPFHRTNLAQTGDHRGWGLGLALVKGIVEAHHGSVKVESYPKMGTTFTLDLPMDATCG